jgi:chromosome segregation ATPase
MEMNQLVVYFKKEEESSLKNDMKDLVRQNDEVLKENESLNEANTQLQQNYDNVMDQLSTFKCENDRLKDENEDLLKVVRSYARNEIRLEEENQALQETLDIKLAEMEINDEEMKVLEMDLSKAKLDLVASNKLVIQKEEEIQKLFNEMNLLIDANGKFQLELDLYRREVSADNHKGTIEALTKALNLEKKNNEALQHELELKISVMEQVDKLYSDSIEEKTFLQQELTKKDQELKNVNNVIVQKEAEFNDLLNMNGSLIGMNNKYQNEQNVYKEELSNVRVENDALKEEIEEASKTVNRLTRNGEKLEEERKALQKEFDEKTVELNDMKELLSNVQGEFRIVVKHVRELHSIKSEIEAELNEFKIYFNDTNDLLGEKWTDIKTLFNDFCDERFNNSLLTSQLEALQDEISINIRSGSPSLHAQGIYGHDSRLSNLKSPDESVIMSETNFSDSDINSDEQQTPQVSILLQQKEEEIHNLLFAKQTMNDAFEKLQMEFDSCKTELSNVKLQLQKLEESNEALMEEKETLQQNLNQKAAEMDTINKLYSKCAEEIQQLQKDAKNVQKEEEMNNLLKEKKSLNHANEKLQMECNSLKEKLVNVKALVKDLKMKLKDDDRLFEAMKRYSIGM